jgi:hypothetical protein
MSRSMTPNFRSGQERYSIQTTPIKKTRWVQPTTRVNPSTHNGPFSTPTHSQQPNFIVRKHARRIAPIWSDQEDEDGYNILSTSPSPNRILDKDGSEIIRMLDNQEYNQVRFP